MQYHTHHSLSRKHGLLRSRTLTGSSSHQYKVFEFLPEPQHLLFEGLSIALSLVRFFIEPFVPRP